ncbi:surface lipoprotein assembly modifier [Roseinatronobacter alkalisoli]|uniref:Surface lipoprotein assembly modifier n=1 Tax=Roseinatronobacter alkalisoli TaxID=3028235 RepID=A0ABT5TA89_9RHOB|nr:surface lipoprotein assembly modifier [Roseinatronobacter sp. HJB301]MDD7972030.1 surface lipoprotein assembly modifier [Roseinatronobacter sp. HJB301]
MKHSKLRYLLGAVFSILVLPALVGAQTVSDARSGSRDSGTQTVSQQEFLERAILPAWVEAVGHMRADRPRAAILILERLVTFAPAEHRFRLELARAYFLVQDDEKAAFHFEQSLGANLPDATRDAVFQYQERIRERKRWEAQLSFSIAPESNPARRTNAETISLLGGEFRLGQDAEAATALHVTGRLTYLPRIGRDLNARLSASLDARVFENSDLNDIRAGIEAGLVLRGDGGREAGIGLSASRRWIGSSPFAHSIGVYGNYEIRLTPRTRLRFRGDYERLRHDTLTRRDGTRQKLQLNLTHVMTPRFGLRGGGFLTRTKAESDVESGMQSGLSFGATYVFEGGLVTALDLGYARERRDGASTLFQTVRSDRTTTATFGLLHREIEFRGYAPRLDLLLERRNSTIELYNFKNARVSVGLTRSF